MSGLYEYYDLPEYRSLLLAQTVCGHNLDIMLLDAILYEGVSGDILRNLLQSLSAPLS
jgi:hypothetical protein